MGEIVLLALSAAFNPTEIAATTVMLLLPSPERLMLGYWLGAMVTGVASGLVIVFALKDTGAEHTTRHTVSPIVQLVFAGLLVLAAVALAKGEGKRLASGTKAHEKKDRRRTAEVAADRCERATPGTRSWPGSCCRFPASPTSPLWTDSSTCTTRRSERC